jgi:hypothetical protein
MMQMRGKWYNETPLCCWCCRIDDGCHGSQTNSSLLEHGDRGRIDFADVTEKKSKEFYKMSWCDVVLAFFLTCHFLTWTFSHHSKMPPWRLFDASSRR